MTEAGSKPLYDMDPHQHYKPEELEALPVLHQGQCCDCHIDTGSVRVWLCRVEGGITIENYINGKWLTVAGDCYPTNP